MQTATGFAAGSAPRILIVRVGAMGDVIHALPAVAMLRAALPEAHIGWAVERRWAPLLRVDGAVARNSQSMPLVDAVHLVEAKQWNHQPISFATGKSIAALYRELRAARYDVAIDLQGTLRSAVIARMSGAARVIGSAAPRESIARFLYRTRVARNATHVIDQAEELVRAGALADRISAMRPTASVGVIKEGAPVLLPRDAAAEAWWKQWRSDVCETRPIALLAATAGWGAKEWPPEKFAVLAAALVDRGYAVLFNTTPGGTDAVTARAFEWLGKTHPEQARGVHQLAATLPQLIAVTRDARAVVAGDTGPLHLASALGVPVVGLFGPTAPERTGPRRRAINLRHPRSMTDHRRHAEIEPGLECLTVDEVLEAFARVTEGR